MELSSKSKGMKMHSDRGAGLNKHWQLMKRKEGAETRREQENVQQRAHWTVEDLPKTASTRPRFQVEYDLNAMLVRRSYCKSRKMAQNT